ncbi:hypothetical protein [Neobacillus sp. FSL H8-0543]|uniref:hypothetical protein n=1 Tax=Neobacillus sp. FSL H8-0543 TaxID=2954672 RepID=UPI003158BED2
MGKQAIHLPKKKQTQFQFQKLKICKKCQRYSVIKEENCPECGAVYVGAQALAKAIFKNHLFSETLWILMFVCIGVIFAPTVEARYYSLIVGVSFALGYVILTIPFIKSEYFYQLKQLFFTELLKIKAGIQYDSNRAREDIKEGNVMEAYDKLQEIRDFIDNDQMKIRTVRALNKIALRKDMLLELELLLPSSYDKDFVKYALEVVKINRQLVRKSCISYFIKYQMEIIRDFGMDNLLFVAGSALRMKLYIQEFSEFIQEFVDYFPKERILRLCRIIYSNPEENWGGLAEKIKRLVAVKYSYDPDFKPYVQEKSQTMIKRTVYQK